MNLQENIQRIREMMNLITEQVSEKPKCDSSGCKGKYSGPEFNNSGDIAHQYSNIITKSVAEKLKELYKQGNFSKVNFNGIELTTSGMGTGNVVYTVNIPFVRVNNKCDAMTGFAHVGGWGHTPELAKRKTELISFIPSGKKENVILGDKLYISQLTDTPEGLEEYWIQWKHRDYQSDCENKNDSQNPVSKTIKIVGNSFGDLRNKLQQQTKNISIDPNSIKVDMDNFTISYNTGDKKIDIISLIIDDKGQLDNRLPTIQSKNPNMEIKQRGNKGNVDWVVSII